MESERHDSAQASEQEEAAIRRLREAASERDGMGSCYVARRDLKLLLQRLKALE